MKYLLQLMRMLHYMMGITAPQPKDERKFLLLWVVCLVAFVVIGATFAYFIVLHVVR